MTLTRPPRVLLAAVTAATALFAVACSSSGGSHTTSTSSSSAAEAHGKPEKAHISVGTLPIADAADLFIAINKDRKSVV